MFINQILTKFKSLVYSKSETNSLLNSKASSSHTHTKSEITDFPTIPSKTSDLTNDSGFITSEVDSSGTSWVRFKSGLQICWGSTEIRWEQQEKEITISFAKSFKEGVSVSLSHMRAGYTSDSFSEIREVTESNFTAMYISLVSANPDGFLLWLAIGYWK